MVGADVFYWPVYPNSHVREVPGFAPVQGFGPYNSGIVQSDGTYLLGVLPGPGAVVVRTTEGQYRPACVDPEAFFNSGKDKKSSGARAEPTAIGTSIVIAAGEGRTSSPKSSSARSS